MRAAAAIPTGGRSGQVSLARLAEWSRRAGQSCESCPFLDRTRERFDRAFKLEAVKLVRERGVSAAQAARDLDVHENATTRSMRFPARA